MGRALACGLIAAWAGPWALARGGLPRGRAGGYLHRGRPGRPTGAAGGQRQGASGRPSGGGGLPCGEARPGRQLSFFARRSGLGPAWHQPPLMIVVFFRAPQGGFGLAGWPRRGVRRGRPSVEGGARPCVASAGPGAPEGEAGPPEGPRIDVSGEPPGSPLYPPLVPLMVRVTSTRGGRPVA
jgi:hypothetical protein